MNATRDGIVAEARSWIGTPFADQGRTKGQAVDCAGVLIGVAHAAGLSDFDFRAYGQQPDPVQMLAMLREHLTEIAFKALLPGDLVRFRIDRQPQHLAIVTETAPLAMVHATNRATTMKVVEVGLDRFWRSKIVDCWRYRGVVD